MKDFGGLGMIFVMDVDGTICFNGLFIEDILHSEIQRIGKNHQIIFASARPIRDLLPVVKAFECPILIGGNGSIVSINNEVSVVKSIPINAFEYIKSLIIKNDLEYIIDGSFDYSANVNPNNKIYRQLDPDHLAKNVKIEEIDEPIKIILINLNDDMFEMIKNNLEKYESTLSINYHKRENNIDITAQNINKYTTLKSIIHDKLYIAYGNDINDYELLKHAETVYYVSEDNQEVPFDNVNIIQNDAYSVVESMKHY